METTTTTSTTTTVLDEKTARVYLDRLLQANDVKGAISFAKRVQRLLPKLKGIFQFLANIVVQASGEDEEIDWYSVFGVQPSADIKTIKGYYVELAKLNRFGPYEAYNIIEKAWNTLSNKFTRKNYDLRRSLRARQTEQTMPHTDLQASSNSNVSAVTNQLYQPRRRPRMSASAQGGIQPASSLESTVSLATELTQPARVNCKRPCEGGDRDQTSATGVKADSSLYSIAGSSEQRMSLVEDISKNVPDNHMTAGKEFDGQKDAYSSHR